MSCPLPKPNWFKEYLGGLLRTPRALYQAALNDVPDPAQASDRFLDAVDGVEPSDLWQAPERLRAPAFMKTNSYLGQWNRADWNYADPRLMVWAAMFQADAKKRGIPLYVHSCLRDKLTQNDLKAKGRSKASYPQSAHNIGEAVDIVHGTLHWDMSPQEWKTLYALGSLTLDRLNATLKKENKLSLAWGGNWSFYDPAHWEVSDFRNRRRELPAKPALRLTPTAILNKRDYYLHGL